MQSLDYIFIKPKDQAELIDQFFATLRVAFGKIKDDKKKAVPEIVKKIEALFEESRNSIKASWKNAYEIEQMLVQFYDASTLDVELNRRLIEVEKKLDQAVYEHYRDEAGKAENGDYKQALLLRIINDLQWYYTTRAEKLEYASLTRYRTGLAFILSTITFLASFLSSLQPDSFISIYITIAAAGLWGASFSALTGLKKQLEQSSVEELKVTHRLGYILIRPIIGVGASLILSFFLQSGMLKGALFPEIEGPISEILKSDYKNFSLLIVWSFIAGFSEKFVTGLLVKTENEKELPDSKPSSTPK